MSNLGVMVSEIASELRRSGMDTAIKRGICGAVEHLKDKRFKWNELFFDFTTTAAEQDYDSADDADIGRLCAIDAATITTPATNLTKRDWAWLKDRVGTSSGTPSDIIFYQDSIWLHPTPASALTINVWGLLELKDANQSAGSQIITRENFATLPNNYTTAWFTEGFDVVKAWAKGYVYLHHLRNKTEADVMFGAAGALITDSETQLGKLGGTSFVRPTMF